MTTTTSTVRVLVAIDVLAEQATDVADLAASIHARLADEAGYLDNGDPITPASVTVNVLTPTRNITGYRTNADNSETRAWSVGADGAVSCVHAAPACCDACVDADERLTRRADGSVGA